MQNVPLLRTRLRPPRLPHGAIERPRLVERALRGVSRGRLFVVAGAGYGKSTLLAQVLHHTDLPAVWCGCDARMVETSALLMHVSAGVEEAVPGFGATLRLEDGPFDQVAALCNEVDQTVVDPLLVVLDDVHELIGHPAAEVLGLLVDHLPPVVRLVVSGRDLPPMPMPRLRAHGLEEIGSRELALDPDEVGALSATLGITLDAEGARRLHRATEGWVAGVLLAGRGPDVNVHGGVDHEAMFDYLAAEVLDRQDPEVVRVMEAAAVLSRFTPALAREVSGVEGADAVIRHLAATQMFTARIEGGEWYRYHHLLRDFLRRRLDEGPRDRLVDLHARAGRAWAALGEPLEAAGQLVRAGAPTEAADVLDAAAESIAGGPDGPALGDLLDAMPTEAWIDRPALVSAQASLQLHRGNHERGFRLAEESIRRLIDLGEHDRAAAALATHLFGMILAGATSYTRVEVANRHLPRIAPCAMRPVVLVMHAFSLANTPRQQPAARALVAEARATALAEGPPVGCFADIVEPGYLDGHVRSPARGSDVLQRVYEELGAHPGPLPARFRLFAGGLAVYLLVNQGRWNEALEWIARSLDFAARLGVQSVDRSTWWWRLVALAGLERWDELAAGLDTAKSVTAMSSHFWYCMRGPDALLAAQRGDRTAVVGLAEAAVAEIRERGEGFDQPWVLCDLSTALLRIGEDERAAALARDAVALAARLGLPWDEARSALRLALACPEPECAEALARALALTAEWGFDDLWVRRERRDAAQGLARALTAGAGPQGFAARLAVSCGGEVLEGVADRLEGAPADVRERFAGSLASASGGVEIAVRLLGDAAPAVRTAARAVRMGSPAAGRPPIHVRAIGGLSVERGGVPVPGSAFGRDKARQLMAALLSAGGPTHREVLLEWLWPELDPVRATRVFHVTLHALRRTLEPDLRPRAPSSLVVLEGDAYRVVLTDGDRFDVAELLDLARVRPGEDPEVRITRL